MDFTPHVRAALAKLGEDVTYTPAGGSDKTVRCLFLGPYSVVNGAALGFESKRTEFIGMTADFGAEYLSLPGSDGNYASTPDSPALSIVGDLDLRIRTALDNWVPGTTAPLIYKWNAFGESIAASYSLAFRVAGTLSYFWSADGVVITEKEALVLTGFANGQVKWIRAIHDVDNGAGGNDVKFYTSDDGVTWTQFGSTQTTAGITSIFDSIRPVSIGTNLSAITQNLKGKVYSAEVRNGIDGPVVAKFDPRNAKSGELIVPSLTGEVWTITPAGSPAAQLAGSGLARNDTLIRNGITYTLRTVETDLAGGFTRMSVG